MKGLCASTVNPQAISFIVLLSCEVGQPVAWGVAVKVLKLVCGDRAVRINSLAYSARQIEKNNSVTV